MEKWVAVEVIGYLRESKFVGDTEGPLRKVTLFKAKADADDEQLSFTWTKRADPQYEAGQNEAVSFMSDGQSFHIDFKHPKRPV